MENLTDPPKKPTKSLLSPKMSKKSMDTMPNSEDLINKKSTNSLTYPPKNSRPCIKTSTLTKNPPLKPPMTSKELLHPPPSTGELKELSAQLKIKDNVDHVGLSQLSEDSKELPPSSDLDSKLSLNNN